MISSRILAKYQQAHDRHLSAPAVARGYRDFDTFALRAGYDNPDRAYAIVYAQWLDACNAFGRQLMVEIDAGLHAPVSVDEYIALLPALVLP